jgi:hypothetical protein
MVTPSAGTAGCGHSRELRGDRRPLAVGQPPFQMSFDGGPVDVGDARFKEISQIGEQSVGVAAVGSDEDFQCPGAHGLSDGDDVVAAAGNLCAHARIGAGRGVRAA